MKHETILAFLFSAVIAMAVTSTDAGADEGRPTTADRIEENKAIARRWFDEIINARDLDAIADIYAPDYVHHGPDGAEMKGLDTIRAFAASILAASEDRQAIVEQQVAEGNLVVTRFTSRGHHTGVFRGKAPTGKIWITEGICISRIEDGKIVEDWEIIHSSGL